MNRAHTTPAWRLAVHGHASTSTSAWPGCDHLAASLVVFTGQGVETIPLQHLLVEEVEALSALLSAVRAGASPGALAFIDAFWVSSMLRAGTPVLELQYHLGDDRWLYAERPAAQEDLEQLLAELTACLERHPCRCGGHHRHAPFMRIEP